MAESQALASSPSAGSPNFAQTGQLDWHNLSRSTVTYSLEVAARIVNAGVGLVTVAVGNAICAGFVFPPKGQLELSGSLTRLKGSSSFSKVLWFGFGIKHVVRSLSETEQGATCVGLCAALAIPYTAFQSAQVLKELCQLCGTPSTFSPSVHEWANLVEVCAGSLSKSSFPKYYGGFTRLLVPSHAPPRAPTPPIDLARALVVLGKISKKTLVHATFVGGLDCAWLASVAQCLLCLNVEIRDENDKLLYKSSTTGSDSMAQAIFVRNAQAGQPPVSQALVQKTCFVSSGDELLDERIDLISSPYHGPTTWSTVLSDTFPNWSAFATSPAANPFARLLECVAAHSEQYYSPTASAIVETGGLPWFIWRGHGCLYHPRRTGAHFLHYAQGIFPELEPCFSPPAYLPPIKDPVKDIFVALKQIERVCRCATCNSRVAHGSNSGLIGSYCLVRIALTVARLLLILAPVIVHEEIPPSITALKQLYNCTSGLSESARVSALPCHGLALVLFIFSGRLPTRQSYSGVSAASAGGVCVYYTLLKSLDLSPIDAMNIEVIPGHIKHLEHIYNFIVDAEALSSTSVRAWNVAVLAQENLALIAEEVEDSRSIAASYRISSPSQPLPYLGVQAMAEALRAFIRTDFGNFEDCGPSFTLGLPGSNWEFQPFGSTQSKPSEVSNASSIHEARWSLITWESWSLPKSLDGPQQQLAIETSQPDRLSLFMHLAQLSSKFSQFPFKHKRGRLMVVELGSCPICIARLACWMWSRLNTLPTNSRVVPFTPKRKTGSITTHRSGHVDTESSFELVPVASPSGLPNRFFHSLRRGGN